MTTRLTSRRLAVVAVCLSLATLVVVGCNGKMPPSVVVPTKKSDNDGAGSAAGSASSPAEAKPIANWPDDLAGVLLISGEMLGYTEPCGCTGGQKGGLIRRMILSNLLRTERKWPVAMIDLGGLLNDPLGKHGGPEQTKIKFETTLRALSMLKYSAVGLSPDDLRIGTDEALMRIANRLPDQDDAPKFVVANATPTPELGLNGRFRNSMRIDIGTYRVGVTSVMDPAAFNELKDVSKNLLAVVPPADVLKPILTDLEKDTDFQVLMVQGPPKMAEQLGLAYPGFDVIVATTPHTEPETKPKTLNGGTTWLVTVGRKGQYLGAIGLPKNKKAPRLYQRLIMNDRYDGFKGRADSMRKLIDEEFVDELKSADVLSSYIKQSYVFDGKEPSEATYVGAEACKKCHPNTYNKWLSTKHAHAYESLSANPKRNREADAECVNCHTTGFRYKGGFTGAESTPNLKGNQCENCHGPGSAHAAAPADLALRKSVARSKEDFKKNIRCIDCHDEDNAPHGFDFDAMWSKIMHNGLDK